jgi:glycosyl hydrolase family 2
MLYIIIMNYLNKLNYKPLLLAIFFLLIFNNGLYSKRNDCFINQSSNTKILLLDSWNVETDNSESQNDVSIPYFIADKEANSVVFNRLFSIPDTIKFSKSRLWILGLHGYAYIYLNNRLIKEHINLSTTHYIDIEPGALKKENNDLKIRLDENDEDGKSHDLRYPNFPKQLRPLGITREIYLEFFPNNFLDKVNLKYKNKNISLKYELNITESSKSITERTVKVEEQILSPSGVTIYKRFEYYENKISQKSISRNINIKYPDEWSNESPDLYTIKLTIKSGTSDYYFYDQKFGLREVNIKGAELLLNNKPFKIKGINYRYNFSNGLDYLKQSKTDLDIIKDSGFNAVRFVNYPPHPSIAQYADSIGIYLFIDNGFWRLPTSYYKNNKYFNAGKYSIKEIGETFGIHPSAIGIGIGNETNINLSNEKKFTIVLKKYLNDNYNVFTYVSPIDYSVKSPNKYSDLLLMQNYVNPEKLFSTAQNYQGLNMPVILGGIHFPEAVHTNNDNGNNKLKRFFTHYDSLNVFNGYFVESYNDWIGEVPNLYTNIDDNNFVYPFGMVDINRSKKEKFNFFNDYLNNTDIEVSYYKNDQKNNFHSLIVFIIAIIFFLIYKRSYRLKENLVRSIQHPYGFFVDLRDRRIISVFNSSLMGLTIGTIISSFVSSILYAFHSSILVDEYVNIFIPQIPYKLVFLSIVDSPWKLFFLILIIISLLQFILVFLLKIIGLFSKEKRKFRQIYSIISWSGSPLLFFIPIAIFAYNFAINDIFYPDIVWLFLSFLLWYNFRIANGFRVLYMIQPAKMILLVFLTYLFLIISFLVYINVDIEVFDYLKTLSAAQNLY